MNGGTIPATPFWRANTRGLAIAPWPMCAKCEAAARLGSAMKALPRPGTPRSRSRLAWRPTCGLLWSLGLLWARLAWRRTCGLLWSLGLLWARHMGSARAQMSSASFFFPPQLEAKTCEGNKQPLRCATEWQNPEPRAFSNNGSHRPRKSRHEQDAQHHMTAVCAVTQGRTRH